MFTGLIEEIGEVTAVSTFDGGMQFTIKGERIFSDLKVDDSIAVNGCCQTVIAYEGRTFTVQSIKETLDKTNFSQLQVGSRVNLERAMLPTQRLGGHFVQGHVNDVGEIVSIEHRGENKYVGVQLSEALFRYCIQEGSIAVDGVSLTIAALDSDTHRVYVSIIPHTWQVTTFGNYAPGQKVNIEVDMLAKMVYQFTRPFQSTEESVS